MTKTKAQTGTFFREFIKSPTSIGAVAPSSRALARMMVSGVDFKNTGCIIEYGAGTGVFTDEIVKHTDDKTKFISFEINKSLSEILRRKHPDVTVVERSVLELEDVLSANGIEQVDCIVSGLPFAVFSKSDQENILRLSSRFLSADGTFRTFAYLQGTVMPAGLRFRRLLGKHFSDIRKSRVVWGNLPPAFVYICKK